jgi:hypothetical protein
LTLCKICGHEDFADLSADTIRQFGVELDGSFDRALLDRMTEEQRFSYADHYRNWPAEHAPTYLRRMLQRYQDAAWISGMAGSIHQTVPPSSVGISVT